MKFQKLAIILLFAALFTFLGACSEKNKAKQPPTKEQITTCQMECDDTHADDEAAKNKCYTECTEPQ